MMPCDRATAARDRRRRTRRAERFAPSHVPRWRAPRARRTLYFAESDSMRIVTGMRKTAFLLAFLLVSTMPALAQTSEVGIEIGGSKRLISRTDQARGLGISDNFKFSNSVREAFYAIQLDPGTFFKIKGGQIEGPVAFQYTSGT